LKLFTWLTASASKLNLSQISFSPLGTAIFTIIHTFIMMTSWGRHGRDRMVVGFTTTYAISGYHHRCCEFKSRSGRGVQHYVIKFVSDRSTCYRRNVSKDATSTFGSNENIFPVCQSFETFHLVDSKCFQIKFICAMPPGGLLKLRPLDSRHRQPIRIVLLYVCWRVENGSAQWRKTYLW
jgi:hypothetical protein